MTGCIGVFIWQFCDVRVSDEWFFSRPRTMNNKGVVDEYRRPKLACSAVKDGADVKMRVEPVYEGNSNKPSEYKVTYSINGEKEVVVFNNRSEAKNDK